MNFADALKLLANGKKIRKRTWAPGDFIYMLGSICMTEYGKSYNLDGVDYDAIWDEFKPPEHKCKSGNFSCSNSGGNPLRLYYEETVPVNGMWGSISVMPVGASVIVKTCPFCGKE